MNRKIIIPATLDEFKGKGWPGIFELIKKKHKNDMMLKKLIEIVKKGLCFEEESLLYEYKGEDKDLIWSCMEFFYQNLWNPHFKEFIWTNPADDWENYNIQLKYKDKYADVTIVYGVGSFCVIGPMKTSPNDKSKVLDLERISFKTNTEVVYYE